MGKRKNRKGNKNKGKKNKGKGKGARRKIKMVRRGGGKIRIRGRKPRMTRTTRKKERRTRMAAVARAPTCCLTLFTTSSGALTWPWNRSLRGVWKTNSITEKIELHDNGHKRTNRL